jgi:hypothetical protein
MVGSVALFEPDPRPLMGPDRSQCALDALRRVVEAGGRRPVQLVGESLITATHGRRTRPSVTAAAVRHLLR